MKTIDLIENDIRIIVISTANLKAKDHIRKANEAMDIKYTEEVSRAIWLQPPLNKNHKVLFETTADLLRVSPADVKQHCINMTDEQLSTYTPESLAKEIRDQWWIRR